MNKIKLSTNIAISITSFVLMFAFAIAFDDIKTEDWWEFPIIGLCFASTIKFAIDAMIGNKQ